MRKLAILALLVSGPAFADDPPKPAPAPARPQTTVDQKLKEVLGDFALRNALLEVTNTNLNAQIDSLNAQLRDARDELEAAKKAAKPTEEFKPPDR